MIRFIYVLFIFNVVSASAKELTDRDLIIQAAKDYIQSQHRVDREQMVKALDPQLAKRTYWQGKDGKEFVLETDYATMIKVAETYNKNGDKFPENPQIDIEILDIDNRVASVKLTADDWIDLMHVYKTDKGDWKIINVLWQFKDEHKHTSQ